MPKPSLLPENTAKRTHARASSSDRLTPKSEHSAATPLDTNTFFYHANFGVYRVDMTGKPLTANLALAKLNGYDSVAELMASVQDIDGQWYVEPQRRQRFLDILMQEGKITHFESEVYRYKTRERMWVSEGAWLVYDELGNPLYYEGTIEDITERKQQERFQTSLAELLEETLRLGPSEQFYKALLRRAVRIIPGSQAGSILLFNGHTYRYVAALGFDLEALSSVSYSSAEMPRKHHAKEPHIILPNTLSLPFRDHRFTVLRTAGRLQDIRATLSIPIVLGDQPLAIINLDNFVSEAAFTPQSLNLANTLTKQLVTVLSRFQLETAIQQRQEVLEQAANFHHSLVAFMNASLRQGQGEDFYARLLKEAVRVVPGAQAGSILSKRGERFHFIASEGFQSQELQQITFSLEELLGDAENSEPYRLILRERPIVTDPERRAVLDTAGRVTDIKVSLCVPIQHNGEVVAFLFLDNFDTVHAFDARAIDMSRIFAEQIGVLLSRFMLERDLSERQHALATWGEFYQGLMQLMNDSLQHGLDQGFYQRLLERAVAVVPGAQMGSIMLRNAEGNYYFTASVGFDLEGLKTIVLEDADLLLDVNNPAPQLIDRYSSYRVKNEKTQAVLETSGNVLDLAVTLSIPIWTDNALAALLFLDNLEDPQAFSSEAVQMAEGFAKQVAILIKRLNLEQALRERQEALEKWEKFRSSLIHFMSETLRRGLDESFYQRLLEHAASVIPGADSGSILTRGDNGRYGFVAALGHNLAILRQVTFAPHELFVYNSKGQPRTVSNLAVQNSLVLDAERIELLNRAGPAQAIKTVLAIPVLLEGEMVAVLSLDAYQEDAFPPEALEMAFAFAAQIGLLLQRLTLEHQLESSNLELAKLANYDALTGLPNRALFADRLAQAIAKTHRQSSHGLEGQALHTALIFLDLDGFKLINDSLGHSVGDELLKTVAARLLKCVREDDTVARLGGDEFTIILTGLKAPQDAIYVAEKVLHSLSQPFTLGGRDLHIGASIGITLYPDDGHTVEELVKHADTAMYHAKALGKNRYHFFTSELNTKALEQLRLENDMRRGLERAEFSLVYQPRIQLQDGKATSFEALLRWQHPGLGSISPSVLIPIAEKSNFIQLLGREVLRQACYQAKAWQTTGKYLRVAVNVSVKQLQQGTLIEDVKQVLDETGLAAEWLELEITESAAMTDVESNIVTLQTLKDMGVSISIDDFGTAYSSLNYLKRLPINSLKIDKSFVEDISDLTSTDTAIVQAVIALGKSLGFNLIAEGVEDEKQLLFLRGAGCNEAQGYWFAKPLAARDTLEWLRAQELSASHPLRPLH
jgi:diguanylate cyclase (GGDEF)-like protein/PAS domain S-box-containing protein